MDSGSVLKLLTGERVILFYVILFHLDSIDFFWKIIVDNSFRLDGSFEANICVSDISEPEVRPNFCLRTQLHYEA